ncbi:hypothetical protein NKH24_35350, partial [Mesorhizobium sp. M1300]|uniref:hypothetical protein n=1 Tax=Mesorhizobium sp. M1300 TaxID=2957077 RepID=UPI003339FAE6
MLLRAESWLTSGPDHNCLRQALAPAFWVSEDGMTPLGVDWDHGFFTVLEYPSWSRKGWRPFPVVPDEGVSENDEL